jgi:hypothetical protein
MKLRALAAACLGLSLLAGCNVEKTAAQAAARRVMVATLVATPEVAFEPQAIAGLDAGFQVPDGGLAFDGGFNLDAGFVVPAQNAALAFFGERQGDGISQPPVPLAGTSMQVKTGSGGSFSLALDESTGAWRLASLDNPAFVYEEGQSYQFIANQNGENHVTEIAAVPPREPVAAFHPDDGVIDLAAGQDFVFVRSDPPENRDRDLAFITVVPISRQGERGAPTYTNVPTDALGLLKLVTAPGAYKRSEVTIPGSAFPERNSNYLLLLQTARVGGPQTANLFIASAILAGSAEVGIVKTAP